MRLRLTCPQKIRVRKGVTLFIAIVFTYFSTLATGMEAFAAYLGAVKSGKIDSFQDRRRSGYFSPEVIDARMKQQQAVVDYQNWKERSLEKQRAKVLGKISQNVDEAVFSQKQSTRRMELEVQAARQKVFAILGQAALFNYVQYNDGKRIWFKDGLAVIIENERILDAQGNVSLRNTYDMEYNSKRLLTSYEADTTDCLGNLTHVKWHGAKYTRDSVFYADDETHAHKLVTDYIQETTDYFGNAVKVEWGGAQYDGKLLTSYHEKFTDARGHVSVKDWYGARYDENKQLVEFQEDVLSVKGVRTHRLWTGGTYIKNPAYDKAMANRGQAQTAPEYLLVSYHEEITDELGNQTMRDWQGAEYNKYGQLVRYKEIQTDALDRRKNILWTKGKYDEYGRLIKYQEDVVNLDETTSQVEWEAEVYDNQHRLLAFLETRTDALGNESRLCRYAIQYNRLGDILAYKELHTDIRGHVSSISWESRQYDEYGRLLAYQEEVVDDRANRTLRIWENAVFDRYDRLLSFSETSVDALGNLSEREWLEAEYDQYGRLIKYREIFMDILGNRSWREWSGAIYDEADRLAAYIEITTDSLGNQTQVKWSAGIGAQDTRAYNEFGQLTAYTEEFTDIYGQTSIRYWSKGKYDKYGNLLEYQENLINPDGSESSRTWTGGGYDDYQRLVSYMEIWDYPGGEQSIHYWYGAGYDTLDRLIEFQERFSDSAGNSAHNYRCNTNYNTLHQVLSYQESVTGSQGVITNIVWSEGEYDEYGRLRGYLQTSVNRADPEVIITTRVRDRAYDRYGELAGGEQTTTTMGTTAEGSLVNAITTTRIQDVVLSSANILTAYTQTTQTRGLDPSGILLDWQETLTVTDITPFSRREIRHTRAEGLDHTVITMRTNITRNRQGQITGYQDEIFDEATPAGITLIQRSSTCYNSRGEIISYRENIQDLLGLVSSRWVSGLLYNGLSQMISSHTRTERTSQGSKALPENWAALNQDEQRAVMTKIFANIGNNVNWESLSPEQQTALLSGKTVRLEDGSCFILDPDSLSLAMTLTLHEETQRYDIGYDVLGRMQAYTQTSRTQGSEYKTITQWEAQSFNPAGLTAGEIITTLFIEDAEPVDAEKLEEYRVPDKSQGNLTRLERTLITYNIFGQLSGYQEQSADSRTPDLAIYKTVGSITYDSLGRVAEQDENARQIGQNTQELPDLEYLNTYMLAGITLLCLNQAAAWQEVAWDEISGANQAALLTGQTITLDSTEGNFQLSLAANSATVILTRIDRTIHTQRSNAQFDSQGRLTGYTEEVTTTGRDSQGQEFVMIETNLRSGIEYDENGRMRAYQEIRYSNQSPGLRLNITRSNITYDPLGQLSGFEEKIVKRAEINGEMVLYIETTTRRSNIIYNGAGLTAGYHESLESSDKPGLIIQIDRIDMQYAAGGRLLGYIEIVQDNQGYSTRTEVANIQTNSLGQETGRGETVIITALDESGQEILRQVQTSLFRHQRYNCLGQKTAYIETRTNQEDDKTITILWGRGKYNSLGQLEAYYQETLEKGPGLDRKEARERVATAYNTLGQIISTTEKITCSDAPDKTVTENTHNITYNERGLQDAFIRDCLVNNADLTITTIRRATTYNDLGLVKGYVEETRKRGQDGTETLDLRVNTVRDSMIYSQGRQLISYHELTSNSDQPDLSLDIQWKGEYNLEGRLTGFARIENNGLLISTLKRGSIAYNSLGQVRGYADTVTNRSIALAGTPAVPLVNITTLQNRGNIEYDNQGRVLAYIEETCATDRPEILTRTLRTQNKYDGCGRLEAWQDEIQSLSLSSGGQKELLYRTIHTRQTTSFNALSLESGYEEEIEHQGRDIRENVSRKNIRHDSSGRTLSYEETRREMDIKAKEMDRTTTINRGHTGYDTRGRVEAYTETRTSSAASDISENIIWRVDEFDPAGRVKASTQTTRPFSIQEGVPLGAGQTKERKNILYDAQNRESAYEEFTYTQGNTTHVQRSNIAYDGRGLQTGYHELTRRCDENQTLEITTETTRSHIQHNHLGRETYYEDIMKSSRAADIITKVIWSQGEYDRFGRLLGYSQNTSQNGKNIQGNKLEFEINTTQKGMTYDTQGRLNGWQENRTSSAEPEITIEETYSGIEYNDRGLRTIFTRQTDKYSYDNFLKQSATTERISTTYDHAGQETGYVELAGNSGAPDLSTTITRENILYNAAQQVSGYAETTHSQGQESSSGQELNTTNIILRSGMEYNLQGDLKAWHEANPAGTIIRNWKAQAFNTFGQLTEYEESGSKPESGAYTRTWIGTYDEQGRNKSFNESLETENGGRDYSQQRREVEYNGKGLVISYCESGSSAGHPDYTRNWNAGFADAYDEAGRITHYKETFIDKVQGEFMTTIPPPLEKGGQGGFVTTQREWSGGEYNGLGQMTAYHETSRETAPGLRDMETVRDWQAGFSDAYNIAGLLAHTEETRLTTYYDIQTGDAMDDEASAVVWKDAEYDDNGQLESFREETSYSPSPLRGEGRGEGDTLFRYNMKYDTGRLQSYHETGSGLATGAYEKDWTATGFDQNGRATGYIENGFSEAGGVNTHLERGSLIYDSHGRVLGYGEKGISGGKYIEREWHAAIGGIYPYDALGRILSWTETGWDENGRYEKSQSGMVYNHLSQQTGYIETGWNISDGQYTKTVSGIVSNKLGQRLFYHQETEKWDKDQQNLLEEVVTDWTASPPLGKGGSGGIYPYNSQGQLLGYIETSEVFREGAKAEDITLAWQADFTDSYTSLGQLAHFKSITTKTLQQDGSVRTTTQERTHGLFAGDGRISAYHETVTNLLENQGESQETTTTLIRSDIEYYEDTQYSDDNGQIWNVVGGGLHVRPSALGGDWRHQGMLSAYAELMLNSNASEKPVQHIMDSLQYDADGRQTGYVEVNADEDLLNANLRRFSAWLNESRGGGGTPPTPARLKKNKQQAHQRARECADAL